MVPFGTRVFEIVETLCWVDTDSVFEEEKESFSIDISFCTNSHHDTLLPHVLQLREWIFDWELVNIARHFFIPASHTSIVHALITCQGTCVKELIANSISFDWEWIEVLSIIIDV